MARDFEDHCWKDIVSPEVISIYEPYRRELRIGSRPALLAIDLYNLVYRGGAEPPHELLEFPNTCGKYAWDAIEPTKKLFAAARAAGLPVVYVTGSLREARVQSTKRRRMGPDPDAYEIFEAFTPEEDDLVVRKERASAFAGTPMVGLLNELDCNSLIVCGESTSGCVRASVVDAYSAGYHVTIAEECVFDRSELSHKVNLFDMHHKYADVMVLDEILEELARRTTRAAAE